jgi:hypothetical protein
MKVGRGFVGPMSNSHRKYTSHRHSFFLYTATLIVLALTLVLAGCGQISLNQLLENQEPGELRMTPNSANVSVDTTITLQGNGGFKPYSYTKLPGSGDGDLNSQTGVFKATVAGLITIEVSDYFGKQAQGTVEIIEQLQLLYSGNPVSSLTVELSIPPAPPLSLDFTATGGLPPYVFSVEGTGASIDPDSGMFTATDAGEYLVDVSDSRDNSSVARVVVIDPVGPLMISPEITYVQVNDTVTFTAHDGSAPYDFTIDAPTSESGTILSVVDNTATYAAPASPTVDIVRLTDSDTTSVTATVYVLDGDPGPLVLSPLSLGDLDHGDVVIFTVSGGLPPYTFWLEYDWGHGTLEQINATQARYTAPGFNTTDWVWVKDAVGYRERVKIKVKSK